MLGNGDFIRESRRIFSSLQDEISRYVLTCRQLFSLTGDLSHIQKMIKKTVPEIQALENLSAGMPSNRKYYIFGAGNYAGYVKYFIHADWMGIADNDKSLWGTVRHSLPVIPPRDLPKDAWIYIANSHYWKEIYHQLREMGFVDGQIVSDVSQILEKLGKRMYFDLPALSLNDQEVFVDGGAYDGFTSKMFARWASGRYDHIYAFEPDEKNQGTLKNNIAHWGEIGRIDLEPYGLWNNTTALHFEANGGQGSRIEKSGEGKINVVALDQQEYADKITFIKMDIEGAEYKALQGAEQIIRNNHPKLAISIYHKPEDIFLIPDFILSCCSDYKLYLRHYTFSQYDTVLYAV